MKRLDLIRNIEKDGAIFIRHGSDHDWYKNPQTGVFEAIPRHRERPGTSALENIFVNI